MNTTEQQCLADKTWFNAVWFQTTWFCAVLGREDFLPLTLALLALHLVLVRGRAAELHLLIIVGGTGMLVDACLSSVGVYVFEGDVLLPLWLCALWIAFTTTTTRSLSFLGKHPAIAAMAGALFLPLNYWAGERLGAVEFGLPLTTSLLLMSVTWVIMLPVLYRLSRHQLPPAVAESA